MDGEVGGEGWPGGAEDDDEEEGPGADGRLEQEHEANKVTFIF